MQITLTIPDRTLRKLLKLLHDNTNSPDIEELLGVHELLTSQGIIGNGDPRLRNAVPSRAGTPAEQVGDENRSTPSPIVMPPTSVIIGIFDAERAAPRIQVVTSIASDVLKSILRDPEVLYKISPKQFEELIMDRLSVMGYAVQQVGRTNQADGGVDIVFRPRPGNGLPFLGAVQVKHHTRPSLKSDVQVIRDMEGVLARHRDVFNLGMVVTNTSFTSEAIWRVNPLRLFLRARDGKDVRRWIEEDFSGEERDVPQSIQLTSKLILELNGINGKT